MKININAIDGYNINISESLRKLISEYTKKRNMITSKYTKEEIDMMPRTYHDTNDVELKKEIEEIMIYYHFPIALIFIKKYGNYIDMDYIDDLFQHCLNVIYKTLTKYNPSMNVYFHTYLSSTMFGEVIKFLDSTKPIKYNYYYVKKKYGEDFTKELAVLNESDLLNMSDEDSIDFVDLYVSYTKNKHQCNSEDYWDFYFYEKSYESIYNIINKEIEEGGYSEIEKAALREMFLLDENEDVDIKKIKPIHISKKYNISINRLYDIRKRIYNIVVKYLRDDEE